MISDADIERRLRLPLTTLCLACVGKAREGDLREAKASIIREVARIVHDTRMEGDRRAGQHTSEGRT